MMMMMLMMLVTMMMLVTVMMMVQAPCSNSKCSTPSAAAPATSPCSERSCKARQLSRMSRIRHNHQLGVWCRGGGGESLSNRTSRRTKRHNYQTHETSKSKTVAQIVISAHQRSTQAAHKWQSHTASCAPRCSCYSVTSTKPVHAKTHTEAWVWLTRSSHCNQRPTPQSQQTISDHVTSTTFAHAPCGSSPACRLHCSSSCSISRASTKPLPP